MFWDTILNWSSKPVKLHPEVKKWKGMKPQKNWFDLYHNNFHLLKTLTQKIILCTHLKIISDATLLLLLLIVVVSFYSFKSFSHQC